ncbi:MAG: hypothetical protein M1834_007011 [Cirrosporium novae-zelandiae]|nr:MAG: hypothetical protein M1834_007011 [Cirrosporium novae-zelandiae]
MSSTHVTFRPTYDLPFPIDWATLQPPPPISMPPIPLWHFSARIPPYTYKQLISMALLRSPNHTAYLPEIHQWIDHTFRWYRNMDFHNWRNDVSAAMVQEEHGRFLRCKGSVLRFTFGVGGAKEAFLEELGLHGVEVPGGLIEGE